MTGFFRRALLVTAFLHVAAEECSTDGDAEDTSCLMQGGFRKSVRSHGASSSQTCFKVTLGADPSAVPANQESYQSHAGALITVTADSVMAFMGNWHLAGVSLANPVIGMHIHEGNSHENGGILVGFCGQDPLPPFSGSCSQAVNLQEYEVMGMACDITGSGSPCVDTTGTATIEDAAQKLMESTDASQSYYLNIHTMYSFNMTKTALGLIRGQLYATACPQR